LKERIARVILYVQNETVSVLASDFHPHSLAVPFVRVHFPLHADHVGEVRRIAAPEWATQLCAGFSDDYRLCVVQPCRNTLTQKFFLEAAALPPEKNGGPKVSAVFKLRYAEDRR
jgi:hypothetical protein